MLKTSYAGVVVCSISFCVVTLLLYHSYDLHWSKPSRKLINRPRVLVSENKDRTCDTHAMLCHVDSSVITNQSSIAGLCYLNEEIVQKLKYHSARTQKDVVSTCISGHVSHFSAICGADGCLRVINASGKEDYTQKTSTAISVLRPDLSDRWIMRKLGRINGWCLVQQQMPFTTDISRMQWRHGVLGSVGEIGVYMGKYASILALNTDIKSGERFFAADIFNRKTKTSQEQGNAAMFLRAMQMWGFSVNSNQSARRLHLWYDSSAFLSKTVFHLWDLPAFRLLSIDGGHVRPRVLKDFEIGACVMREGGILVFDDALNVHKNGVRLGIQDFFRIYGAHAFKPLVYFSNKLFVCTTSYFDVYFEFIRNHLVEKYSLKDMKDTQFLNRGNRYFY